MKLGLVELEMLHLGASLGREFDEKDIEKSNLKKYGVGRILDTLAALKENNFIKINTMENLQLPIWRYNYSGIIRCHYGYEFCIY